MKGGLHSAHANISGASKLVKINPSPDGGGVRKSSLPGHLPDGRAPWRDKKSNIAASAVRMHLAKQRAKCTMREQ